jgi:glycosyltransferase involved in cell wall biosynthesis
VINTRLDSGVPFVSLDRVTGLTVPHSDPGALARAIHQLLDDSALRAEFGQAARSRAEIMFRSATMSVRTLRTYEIALSNQPLPIAETQQTLGGRDDGGSIFANSSGRAASEAR